MDHLVLPKDREITGSFSIPFLAADAYSRPFNDYPDRSGWKIRFDGELNPELVRYGTSQSDKTLVCAVQEWLYFGMLAEFLDDEVDMTSFRKPGENGPLFVSDNLESLVCTKTNSLLSQGPAAVNHWKDSFYQVLLTAWHTTILLIGSCGDTVNDLTLTCMAISVLAEYLMNAMNGLCIRVKVDPPVTQKFRKTVLGRQFDCGLPITQRMKQRGWCPHDVELLKGSQIQNVSTLWYLANLSPPKSHVAHGSCTPAKCKPYHIDKKEYVPRHVRNGCHCVDVGPDQNELEQITRSENIPLVRVLDDEVQVFSHKDVGEFITISHVWADGKGNPRGNALPLCVMQEIQQLVNRLPHKEDALGVPFWLDTLCIPRHPEEVRRKAILRMREPYEQALHVLVIDAYLRSHNASETSPFEILARIQVCGWSQRLWTFQEGRIPRGTSRTWFPFNDKIVDLVTEVDLSKFSLVPTLPSRTVHDELLLGHNQTQIIGEAKVGFNDDIIYSPLNLRRSLASRATSRNEDEALCIGGGIVRLPRDYMEEIVHLEDGEARMARVWAKLPKLHAGFAFSKAPRKLNIDGFRWAPATFMGDLTLSSPDWEGPNECWDAPPPSLSPAGLTISRPAWQFLSGDVSYQEQAIGIFDQYKTPLGKLFLSNGNGQWFGLDFYEPWHDKPRTPVLGSYWAVILAGSHDLSDVSDESYRSSDEFTSPHDQQGLLVSYRNIAGREEPVKVTPHRHVRIGLVSSRRRDAQRLIREHADRLCDIHPERVTELRQKPDILEEFIRSSIGEEVRNDKKLLEIFPLVEEPEPPQAFDAPGQAGKRYAPVGKGVGDATVDSEAFHKERNWSVRHYQEEVEQPWR
ncbi:hypothetical protein PG991_015948 [Apiospora marii]|uniref:Heterokaryon incompatibility domain-containing protein n=1 Tax=Apiospora marii TaxID=335849 RepID=A0ABR1R0A2_9PEZI